MTGRVSRILICLILGVEMMTMSVAGCSGTRHKDRFQWAEFVSGAVEYKAAHKNEPVHFDVRRIMPFGWEKFYVFPPYTTVAAIESALGFNWGAPKTRGLASGTTSRFSCLSSAAAFTSTSNNREAKVTFRG